MPTYKEKGAQVVERIKRGTANLTRDFLAMKDKKGSRESLIKGTRNEIIGRILASFLLSIWIVTEVVFGESAFRLVSSNGEKTSTSLPSLDVILSMNDEDIDLFNAYLVFSLKVAKDYLDYEIEPLKYQEMITTMAEGLSKTLKDQSGPKEIVEATNLFFFKQQQFVSDANDPLYNNLKNLWLNTVLDNKVGNCVSLTMIYLSLAERLGLSFNGVATPEHVFVRFDDGSQQINVEMTKQGERYSNSTYAERYKIPAKSALYLNNLSKKALLSLIASSFGQAFSDRRQYHLAIDFFDYAQKLDRNNVAAYLNLGAVYRLQNDFDNAIRYYEKALEIDPSQYRAWSNIGEVYIEKGDTEKAVKSLEKAIRLNPDYDKAYYNLGVAYLFLKKDSKNAIKSFEKALEINPDLTPAKHNLSLLKSRREE